MIPNRGKIRGNLVPVEGIEPTLDLRRTGMNSKEESIVNIDRPPGLHFRAGPALFY